MKQFPLSKAEVDRLMRRIFLVGAVFSSVLTAMFVVFLLFLLSGEEVPPGSSPRLWGAVGGFVLLDLILWAMLLRPFLQIRKGVTLILADNMLSVKLANRVREMPLKEVERAVFYVDGLAVERIELVAGEGKPVTLRGFEDMDGLAKTLAAELPGGIIERKQRSA